VPAQQPKAQGSRDQVRNGDGCDGQLDAQARAQHRRQQTADAKAADRGDAACQDRDNGHNRLKGDVKAHSFFLISFYS